MVKIINIFGDVYSGQAGKAGVFAKWKGRQYRRKYVIPANPKTTMQKWIRDSFAAAVTEWHTWHSLQRLVFSYLATGLVMSGFNLLVSRWQKATAKALPGPLDPKEGIKQITSLPADQTEEGITANGSEFVLNFGPISIGSLVFNKGTATPDQAAYIDLEMGDVRIPTAITQIEDGAATLVAVAPGDKLLISYDSGGREVVDEELYVVPAEGVEIPAKATIGVALRTKYYPIDFKSVVLKTYEATLEHSEQIESLEIDNINKKIFFDMTAPSGTGDSLTYVSYTAIQDAKLEVTKVDTSFITWRRYSDKYGHIPIAQTIEDGTYDITLTKGGYVGIIRADQTAQLATKHELITMEEVAA
ncbi:hypothetical protein ES705_47107 [subsurface metagenome]